MMRKLNLQIKSCMNASLHEFPLRSPDQLSGLLQSFRKTAGLTQAQAAAALGVTQQTLSALERNAANVSAARLLKLLGILGVEMVLRPGGSSDKARW
jgi:HTH-type transcriptional regulator / antitoxin HipB